jgi:hypothetical protein
MQALVDERELRRVKQILEMRTGHPEYASQRHMSSPAALILYLGASMTAVLLLVLALLWRG